MLSTSDAQPGGVRTDPTLGNTATGYGHVMLVLIYQSTDGVAAATTGWHRSRTRSTASNAGPSNATGCDGDTITFPCRPRLYRTCVAQVGGTCTASGSDLYQQHEIEPAQVVASLYTASCVSLELSANWDHLQHGSRWLHAAGHRTGSSRWQ